jgi:hypothetical protein
MSLVATKSFFLAKRIPLGDSMNRPSSGTRGMGALEFAPLKVPKARTTTKIEIDTLVRLAGEVLTHRGD